MAKSNPKQHKSTGKFPLTLHPTGQYCKKIRGKVHYFGTDKKAALREYLEQATFLHTGERKDPRQRQDGLTLKDLCNLYLEHQHIGVEAGQITASHFKDQLHSLRQLTCFVGQNCLVDRITTLVLQNYRYKLLKSYSHHRVNLHLSIMKAMFHWARKNDITDRIPNIDAIAKVKVKRTEKPVFAPEEIHKLVSAADTKMRAMIWLALNCGFGCTDCAELKWENIDFVAARVSLPRTKTGIPRNLPLWPETVDALQEVPRVGDLVFYTARGNSWVRTIAAVDRDGRLKYSNDNAVTKEFSKLLKKAGIEAPRGVGFYTLRRTAATWAAKSGDPFAVQRLLGHADLKMATTYVQDLSEQTDRVINESRAFISRDDS